MTHPDRHPLDGNMIAADDHYERPEPEEGSTCNHCGNGVLEFAPAENCYCHISPPCGACMEAPLRCDTCGEAAE